MQLRKTMRLLDAVDNVGAGLRDCWTVLDGAGMDCRQRQHDGLDNVAAGCSGTGKSRGCWGCWEVGNAAELKQHRVLGLRLLRRQL